jgi:glycosyltransferase involved in cell wall biosynthesis
MMRKKTLLKVPNVGFPSFGMCGWPILGRKAIRTAKRSDAVVALCPKTVEELRSAGFSSRRIFKVTNGTDVRNPCIDRGSRDRREIRVVYLGRLVPDKGIVDLLKAWKIVRTEGGDLESVLNIYGDGPQRAVLDKTIGEESLAESVRLCGRVDDVRSVMDEADILAHPSYREGNSNTVLEAMASGIPVVGSDISGNSILVGKSGSRFLHGPGDHVNLARILLQLMRDANLRREAGREMRERVVEFFPMDHIKDKYVLAYRMILDGRADQICDLSDFPKDS